MDFVTWYTLFGLETVGMHLGSGTERLLILLLLLLLTVLLTVLLMLVFPPSSSEEVPEW